jgi:hypothetical protein
MKTRPTVICVALLVVAFSSPSWAVPITFEFTGQVTSIVDADSVLAGEVAVGHTFTGSYTFESTLPDSYPYPDPNGSRGYYASPSSVMHVNIGAFDLWSGTQNLIQVVNESSIDALILSSTAFRSSGLDVEGMVVKVHDSSGVVFDDDSLPATLPPFSAFSWSSFQIEGRRVVDDPVGFAINGVILTLTPEPTSFGLLIVGAVLSGKRRSLR